MAKQKQRGLWIPQEIVDDKNLTLSEKLILSVVAGLSDGCFAKNESLAKMCGLSIVCVRKALKGLEDKGYIDRSQQGKSREIKVIKNITQGDKKYHLRDKKYHPLIDNNTIYNTSYCQKRKSNNFNNYNTEPTSYNLEEVEARLRNRRLIYTRRDKS